MALFDVLSRRDIDKITQFKLRNFDAVAMSELVGTVVDVDVFAIYTKTNYQTGEVMTVAAIKTADGGYYATNSNTFIAGLKDIYTIFGDVKRIRVVDAKGTNGRFIRPEIIEEDCYEG